MSRVPSICMTFAKGGAPGFSLLLQSGFLVSVPACGSIRSFLTDGLGLSPEFIDGAIQSVFLDGKPVDDLDAGMVHDGCVLALSAAMPGLVGATMRRGGYYSCMRSGISHREGSASVTSECGEITVKLFNLIASELGPSLLSCGLRVKGEVLVDFFESRAAGFWDPCEKVVLDGNAVNPQELAGWLRGAEAGILSVRESEQPRPEGMATG
ncbi:MAG: hypothetical protein AB9873_02190 [Syntrophobacteraceae bacterium]